MFISSDPLDNIEQAVGYDVAPCLACIRRCDHSLATSDGSWCGAANSIFY
jgi:hypothetical protein